MSLPNLQWEQFISLPSAAEGIYFGIGPMHI